MKRSKNTILIGIIYAIIIGVVNTLIFFIFKKHTSVFWISYCFMMMAFIVQIVSIFLSFRTTKIEAVFFGIPLASFSIYYICVALFVGLIFMIFQGASVTLTLIIQLIILAVYLIIAIISLMTRDVVEDVNAEIKGKITRWKTISNDTEIIYTTCDNSELKERLGKLSETIKYSDPMSNASVNNVEERICLKINELREYCENDKVDDANKVCSELELLCTERNSKLSISK